MKMQTIRALAALVVAVAGMNSAVATAREDVTRSDDAAGANEAEYVIGVNDMLHVYVWAEDTLTRMVRVRPDGMITLPLIDDVKASGRTPEQLRDDLAQRLIEFVKTPNVTVIVEQIESRFVYVLGEVTRQGVVSLNQPLGVLEVIATQNGLTDFSREKVTIIRTWGGVESRIEVDLEPLFKGDPDAMNVPLEPGDVLLVR